MAAIGAVIMGTTVGIANYSHGHYRGGPVYGYGYDDGYGDYGSPAAGIIGGIIGSAIINGF